MKLRGLLSGAFLAIVATVVLLLQGAPTATAQQPPAFELPVELVGFPVIIVAVRLSNFVKKLAYSLNPRTYAPRSRRAVGAEDMIDMVEAEKRLISELGENVCIYTRVCLHHAEKANKSLARTKYNLDWNDIFRNLSSYALQNSQNHGRQTVSPPYIQQGPPSDPYQDPNYPNVPQNFMDALALIAYNDNLHCVSRLLCELTSGSRSSAARGTSFLPFNINMDSLLGLLSSLPAGSSSPLVLYGRAALLGYTSQGSSSSCLHSFPRCPSDPDKLVNYLNNYNGGFFRYFNGIPRSQPNQYYPQQFLQRYGDGNYGSQQRILTKPSPLEHATSFGDGYGGFGTGIKFPASNEIKDSFYGYRSAKTLAFPGEGRYGPQTLTFPAKNAINHLDFQRPLPNHVASPNIFPMRTGTGELILDTDAFDFDYRKSHRVAFT